MKRFQVYISTAPTVKGYGSYINVFVIELDFAKLLTARLQGEGKKQIKSIRSSLIKNRWVIAKQVYNGATMRSAGQQAIARANAKVRELEAAAELSARLGVEAPWETVKLHNVLLACVRAGR